MFALNLMKWFKLNKIGSIVTALGMESIVRLYYLLSDVKNTLINCVPTVKRSVGSRQYSKTECQSVIDDPFIGKFPATVCLVTIMPFQSSPGVAVLSTKMTPKLGPKGPGPGGIGE